MRKFSPLRLMTSHTHLYAKLEEFGKDYNVATTNRVADECQYLNMHHRPTAPLAQNSHLATGANLEQLNQESAHTTSMAHVNLEAEHSTGMAQVNLEAEHTTSMAQVNLETEHSTSMAQVNLGAERSTSLIQMTSWSSKGASSQNPMLTQPEATTSVGQPTTCTSSNIIDTAP